jgi:hypothetical protein
MSPPSFRVLIGLAICGVFLAAGLSFDRVFTKNTIPKENDRFGLSIPEADLNFGEIWQEGRTLRTITIQNNDSTIKKILSIQGSCTCQSFSPSFFSLAPGQSQAIELAILHQPTKPTGLLDISEPFSASIRLEVEGQRAPSSWTLRGRFRHSLRYPSLIDLGRTSELAPEKAMKAFPVFPLVNLSGVRLAPESSLKTAIRNNDSGYDILIEPSPGLPRGKHSVDLTVTPIHRHEGHLPPLTIPVQFEVCADTNAVPDVVNFGNRQLGEHVVETVTLHSTSGRPFRVLGFTTEGEGLVVKDATQFDHTSYSIECHLGTSTAPRSVHFSLADALGARLDDIVVPVHIRQIVAEETHR